MSIYSTHTQLITFACLIVIPGLVMALIEGVNDKADGPRVSLAIAFDLVDSLLGDILPCCCWALDSCFGSGI
jgi:hypothetical protein